MNILLIYPALPNTFWSFKYALKFVGKKAAYPPLGLLTVAAMLPEEFNRRLVDVNVDALVRTISLGRIWLLSEQWPFRGSPRNTLSPAAGREG
jgi:radical SAM superfamily enzyme YgiQ (UPF0313 family)